MAGGVTGPAVFSLAGGAEAACAARRAVRALDGEVPSSVRDDLLLLLTEPVTNAVRHGDASTGVDLRLNGERPDRGGAPGDRGDCPGKDGDRRGGDESGTSTTGWTQS